jgi:peptidoglycan/xylan/chitin deacetylase (PgdA/CDA1 family)
LRACSVAALRRGEPAASTVAMTFDDGHASNAAAAEELAALGFSADFFVNPSTVGTAGYLSWDELKAMAAMGMSIQSHGYFHRYLDELTPDQVMSELVDSKREIENRIGQEVTVFAPPGGRTAAGMADVAARAGYSAVCTSRVGIWQVNASHWQIPRLAVLKSTTEAQFLRWIEKEWQEIAAQRARYVVLSSAKRLLGNRGYERLRLGLLRSGRP